MALTYDWGGEDDRYDPAMDEGYGICTDCGEDFYEGEICPCHEPDADDEAAVA